MNTDGFKPNFETHMKPVLASTIKDELNRPVPITKAGAKRARTSGENGSNGTLAEGDSVSPEGAPANAHHSVLMTLLAKELGCAAEDIVDLDLQVCDTQPSTVGGVYDEFVFSGRLDNLCMSYCSLRALADSTSGLRDSLAEESGVRMVALFDHEEVGSSTACGAGSPMMRDCMTRVSRVLGEGQEGGAAAPLNRAARDGRVPAHARAALC